MNIYAVRLITFSPTHTSKQVGEAIVRGTGISDVARTDLTFHPAGKLEIPENTLTVNNRPRLWREGGTPGIGADERRSCFRCSGGAGCCVW